VRSDQTDARARTPPRRMSTQRRSWHTRYLPQSPARSHASARNMPKVHHANVSTSAKTWVLCVQEWLLSSRDRLKKSRVLARATCECSSCAPHRSRSPTARVLCNMHSATLQPALIKRSPSMVSQHAADGGSGGGGSGAATELHVAAAELTAAAQASAPAAAAATHWRQHRCSPSSAALSLRRSLCALCTLAAPSTHHFSTRCRCSPCRAPSAAARAMCSDTRRRLEEAQGAGAGAGQQGEPVEQYGDALGLWLVEGCVNG